MKTFLAGVVGMVLAIVVKTGVADACVDMETRLVGTASVSFQFVARQNKVKVCFTVNITKKNFLPRYVGFRFPAQFSSVAGQASKEIQLTSPLHPGKVRAFNYHAGKRYCLVLTAQGYSKIVWRNERQETIFVPAKQVLQTYRQNLQTNRNIRDSNQQVSWKIGKSGVTVGNEFLSGYSGFKTLGCGTSQVDWTKMAVKQRPPVRARANDF